MRLKTLAIGAALVGLGAGSAAVAQTMPAAQAKSTTDFGLILTGIHDSNLAGGSGGNSTLTPDDYTFRPEASFSINKPLGRNVVYLRGTAGYDFHQQNQRLNSRRLDVTSGGILRASACQAALFGAYNTQQSQLADVTQASVLNRLTQVSEGAGLSCGRSGLSGQLVVSHMEATNSLALTKTADHHSKGAALSVAYGRPSLGSLGVSATYSEEEYPNRPDALGAIGDGFKTESYGVNYQKRLGQKLSFTVGVADSVVHRRTAPPGIALTSSGLNYSLVASYALSSRLNFNLNVSKSTVPSNQAGKLVDTSTRGDLSASYKLGSRFTFGLGGDISDSKSNADTTLGVLAITNSRVKTVYGSLNYRQSQRLGINFDVRHEERVTNLPQFDYSDTRVSLSTALSF